MIDDENLIGHFTTHGNKFKRAKEINFHEESRLYRMALIERNSKLLITDWKRNLLHLVDLEGNILKSFNPNNILKSPVGVCVLNDSSSEEQVFIGDDTYHKIFVFNSNFELTFQFGDQNLLYPHYMIINGKLNESLLYVSDWQNNEITIWDASNGRFINKINIETPFQIKLTINSLFVSSHAVRSEINNKNCATENGRNCIFEFDKESLEVKRKIIGNWYSPKLLNIESNGNLQISARTLNDNNLQSEMRYFLTIDQTGKILKKLVLEGFNEFADLIFVDNKIIGSSGNKLKIFEFE